MKAIRMHARGGPEQLSYDDAPKPVLTPGDALVRVFASAITTAELTWSETYQTCDGKPRIPTILGHEFSGIVEAISPDVNDVAVGEQVYGLAAFCRDGSAADYVAVNVAGLALKPMTLDHVHAASLPLSALTAWQAFFDHSSVSQGKRVLIHGAAGGVGIFAVQLAAWKGAHVIATASSRNHKLLSDLGAKECIDYTKVRFEDEVSDIDVVLDTIGGDTLERSWGVLRPGGTLVCLNAKPDPGKAAALGVRALFFIVEPNRSELIEIARLIDSGILRTFLDAVLPLEQAKLAFEHGLQGHSRGKIVLRVAEQTASTGKQTVSG
jgi:NADPH:quinone reductase-like Zn-dependent oxidoreductase